MPESHVGQESPLTRAGAGHAGESQEAEGWMPRGARGIARRRVPVAAKIASATEATTWGVPPRPRPAPSGPFAAGRRAPARRVAEWCSGPGGAHLWHGWRSKAGSRPHPRDPRRERPRLAWVQRPRVHAPRPNGQVRERLPRGGGGLSELGGHEGRRTAAEGPHVEGRQVRVAHDQMHRREGSAQLLGQGRRGGSRRFRPRHAAAHRRRSAPDWASEALPPLWSGTGHGCPSRPAFGLAQLLGGSASAGPWLLR
jgi:hypothetical protein